MGAYAGTMGAGTAAAGAAGVVGGLVSPMGLNAAPFVGSVFGGSGKHKDQKARDSIRDLYKNTGLVNDNYQVSLADGSQFDLGLDGDSGRRTWAAPDRRMQGAPDELNAYDIDYTSDLDFFSGMGGITLSRLLTGSKATNVDQMGGQLGNAAISNIGFGAPMTQENFNKMTANQRAMYAQSGINSKEEALALTNEAFSAGRIKENDIVSMQQSINMVYDDDYALANKLNSGRWKGLEGAAQVPQGSMLSARWHKHFADIKQTARKDAEDNQNDGTGAAIGAVAGAGAGAYFSGGNPMATSLGGAAGGILGGLFD